ncbi:CopG family transcriptional regulator [Bacillus pseudomycoides]|uniref:CopG family transcriptional regulator n=1 Tax=Bacillus pseudomycoides TaxID=64104 RepID=A0AA91ZRN6_9BACI|nr:MULTISPECIES: CopG family transcriptional regulator [Bacillus]PEB51622.1 CopG family transcriptional regulator [Bacillus sp. AFS098217]PED80830.1 CopG family transcriptional regulator [Bacillus pseudomycoides]PEU11363.1 CopG family transcriptional regulator [Bacillus sp. AFS014408]PEU17469.1 CopG family transcriptional regulator [Bacillus sp. AFS019443]PFW63566.1 CopG family transcriptional regulator [Bacillus sp. AFS075034]
MNLESILNELENNRILIVAKQIGISHKKLSKALKAAGYEYKRGLGWHFKSTGEPPLKADIGEFIVDTNDAKAETPNNVLTKNEVNALRMVINEWGTTKNAVNAIMQQKEKISAQKNTNPIHSLYMRIGESGAQEKASRTVNLDKEICARLDGFEDKHRLNRDEIVEIALCEFFEKYKAQ